MYAPIQYAFNIAYFGSEEAILAGEHIQWFISYQYPYEYEYDYYDYSDWFRNQAVQTFELTTPDREIYHATVSEAVYFNDETRIRQENAAIQWQLSEFRRSVDALKNIEGLYYFIETYQSGISATGANYNSYSMRNGLTPEMYSSIIRDIEELYDYSIRINLEENIEVVTPEPIHVILKNVGTNFQSIDFFKKQPVYFLFYDFGRIDHSGSANSPFYYGLPYNSSFNTDTDITIYLAFSDAMTRAHNSIFQSARSAYITDFSILAVCLFLVLATTIVLIIGAGRKTVLIDGIKVRSEEIHFSPIDKLYLDVGLIFISFLTLFVLLVAFSIFQAVFHYRNIIVMNIVIASAVLLTVPAALFWLMNFTKRIKAGQFWKHTLIYATLRLIKRTAKSLWTGANFALKIALITVASFLTMIFVTWFSIASNSFLGLLFITLLVSSVIAILLTLYARRIRNLENGAKAASEGKHDVEVSAGGGELGRIAGSINSISAGINLAVEERMKSERLKTELITNVSHDIRTPLTSIITYTDLLEREGLSSEKAADYLEILKQKSLRLKTLTDELFEAAKASTGNIDVNLADLNIVSLINQVLGELDNSVKSSGLDLRVDMPDKLIAIADGRLMHRVVENLLSNVFKYSQEGSRVYLDVLPVSDKEVRIDIKNISASALNFDPSELMERFKRGDDSRTDGGSGLGLSIVQSFVDAQGGRFEIKIDGDLFKATVILPQPKE